MIVHLYATSWNDAHMLKYFFLHYDDIVDEYFIFDDASTDDTLELLAQHPKVTVERHRQQFEDSWVKSAQYLYNHCWKRSRGLADWVIVINLDEHLYHPEGKRYLQNCQNQGITLIPSLGYQMLSEDFPTVDIPLHTTFTEGAPWLQMSKLQVFNPNAIEEINFTVGRHRCQPEGVISIPAKDELLNLHYKYLGISFLKRRQAELATGLRKQDIERRWGFQYLFNEEEIIAHFNSFRAISIDVFAPDYQPARDYTPDRWWQVWR